MKRMQIAGTLALLLAVLGALPAIAAQPASNGDPAAKLARGVANVVTGWMELPKETARGAEAGELSRLLAGVVTGVAHAVVRTGAGAYEVGTFLLPIPDGYGPVIEPATLFESR